MYNLETKTIKLIFIAFIVQIFLRYLIIPWWADNFMLMLLKQGQIVKLGFIRS